MSTSPCLFWSRVSLLASSEGLSDLEVSDTQLGMLVGDSRFWLRDSGVAGFSV